MLTGVEITKAQGQAITNITKARYSQSNHAPPINSGGNTATNKAMANTMGVYHFENWSTKRCVGARLPWADSTAAMMRAKVELLAAALTWYSNEPASLIVPANTASPTAFSTGKLSPVMGAWLMLELPLVSTPSSAKRSPGFTRTVLPTVTALANTSCHAPSACKTVAFSGLKSNKPRMALRARSSDLASINSAMVKSTITIAASGQWPMMTAPVTAIAIKALMFKLKFLSAIQPFW